MNLKIGLILIAITAVVAGGVGWASYAHHPSTTTLAATSAADANPEDTDVDTLNNATVLVQYRPDLSDSVATFDVTIKTAQQDLTKYDYQSKLILADGDINPLPHLNISVLKSSPEELQVRFTTRKFPGDHFHFIVRDVNGVHDRLLHFYRQI